MPTRLFFTFTLLLPAYLFPGDASAAQEFDALGSGFRVLWGLLVVLAIMFIAYALLRKRVSSFQHKGKGHIEILEMKAIPPRRILMLIEVRGREYLVGGGHDSISIIVPLPKNESFSSYLQSEEG